MQLKYVRLQKHICHNNVLWANNLMIFVGRLACLISWIPLLWLVGNNIFQKGALVFHSKEGSFL